MLAPLLPLVTQMVIEGITKGTRPMLPRVNAKGIGLVVCAAILGILGLGFLLFAGFIYLQNFYDTQIAALIVAGGLLVLALVIGLLGRSAIKQRGFVSYYRASSSSSPVSDIAQTVKDLIEGVTQELEEPIRENPKTAIALASLAGYLAGDLHKRR